MAFSKYFLLVTVALLVSACGSSVKLDDVPVEDRSGTSTTTNSGTTGTAGTGNPTNSGAQSAVPTVSGDLSKQGLAPVAARVVYFDYDSFLIKPEFQSLIETNARAIKADASRKVAVEGHTDERGGREYNLALGQKRAEAVRRALGLLGVSESQVEAVSFGKEKPADNGSDDAAMAKNRRAEISYR